MNGELAPGVVIEGKYRLEREIGKGGMGVVYEATHLMLARKVAIKVLSPAMRERPDLAHRMIREARAVSTIGHPNIVAVTDLGMFDGTPFIVMELLAGVSLEDELAQRGPMGLGDAIGIVVAVLDALDAVHRHRIVHRDIKPANIMLVRDASGRRVVKVLDFGIAKVIGGDEVATKTSVVLGTPQGMAPEQALGEDVDGRADLHAVGALLYTLLVGEPPFAAREANAAVARMLEGRFAPASERVASVPREVDAVIARALLRAREQRFPDAAAMREALQACVAKPGGRRARQSDLAVPRAPEVEVPQPIPVASAAPAGDRRFSPTPVERLDVATLIDRLPARVAEGVPSFERPWRQTAAIVAITVAVGIGGWLWYRARPPTSPTSPVPTAASEESGERILLMISTTPKDASVLVDDVAIVANPVELPRSDTPVRVRVEAKGYVSRVVEVEPVRSRRVEVVLDRAAR